MTRIRPFTLGSRVCVGRSRVKVSALAVARGPPVVTVTLASNDPGGVSSFDEGISSLPALGNTSP